MVATPGVVIGYRIVRYRGERLSKPSIWCRPGVLVIFFLGRVAALNDISRLKEDAL